MPPGMKKPELTTIKVTKPGEIFGFYGRKILKYVMNYLLLFRGQR
jgi:hypothetical protein